MIPYPPVLASQSAQRFNTLLSKNQRTIDWHFSNPWRSNESLQSLATLLGIQAIGVAPYAGDKRKIMHLSLLFLVKKTFMQYIIADRQHQNAITKPTMELNPDTAIQTYEEHEAFIQHKQ